MAENFLSSDVAGSIRDALLNDGTFAGTESWADAHGFDLDEYRRFLDFGVDLAKMHEYRTSHMDMPPMVEAKAVIEKGVVDKKGAKLTVSVRAKSLSQIQPFIDETVFLEIYPEQMPLPMDTDGVALVDVETGEVVDG